MSQGLIVKMKTAAPPFSVGTAALLTPPPGTVGTQGMSALGYLASALGGARTEQIIPRLYVVKTGGDSRALSQLQTSSEIEYAEPDPIAYALRAPNDPDYPLQWAHRAVHSEEAWTLGTGNRSVIVAEIDTGVDYTHPDLAANIWTDPADGTHGMNFVTGSKDPMADDAPHFHGTHVAGSIGALGDNGVGVTGSSPQVTILPLKFLSASGYGDTSNAVRAIYFAIAHGARVMSNSWGSNQPSQALRDAIAAARDAGILFVVAAGNGDSRGIGQDNDRVGTYPANYGVELDNVISVAATDSSDQLTAFSNYGAASVHIAAPGEQIYSTMNGSGYQYMSGTSMATPLVAGVAATLFAAKPTLSYAEAKRAILDSADRLPQLQGRVVTGGRINAYRALAAVTGGVAPQPAPGPQPTPAPEPSPVPEPSPMPRPAPAPTGDPGPLPVPQPPAPLLNGSTSYVSRSPFEPIAIDFDGTAFPGTLGAFIEVSRPGAGFSNPNGDTADPFHQTFAFVAGARNRFVMIPARDLPAWGVYQIRVIPLGPYNQPTGRFSNPAAFTLTP